MEATRLMNFSGTVSKSLRTNSSSSNFAPTLLYFETIPDNFPTYSSIDSPSFICSPSNSDFRMRNLAF
ncbi:hypothetical protein HanIR_Chr17g0853711 [Helianthus annuus]|nr:hypothetical protein HanIR_Chr17g0853711 [Helianthus annuus]